MFERLNAIVDKFNELQTELTNPDIISDYNKLKALSKESSDLEETVKKYQEYKDTEAGIEDAKALMKDEELKEMATLEYESLKEKLEVLTKELEILLVPKDENDGKNVIMEIRGAAGGDEANIFAGDLYRMYTYYAEKNNWKIEELHALEGTSGGYSQVEILIKGEDVYKKLKYESGSHRVQRVPVTETQGRVHTSTATVLVMPEVETANIELKESDIKMDVYHSSGAGGQSVNTSNSAVRLTHIPTGIAVTCQVERSQLKNRERAMNMLKIKINDEIRNKEEQKLGEARKNKIGTGDRSEKIRTYNYPQNRVTDHRINFSIMSLDRVMDGELEPVIEALQTEDLRLKLAGETFE
ncbi:MAG: peptide chain release factor 1 [Bacilli bacterium]|jgi:peptide chain release factor 1|nr:peptide chain release factor 1 [Bacilli bacterium]